MKGHLTESRIETDGTDELPVLSDEAVLRFQVAPTVAPATLRPPAPLEASLEALRVTLEAAERRWQTLERRLKSQDRAIAELKTALHRPTESATEVRAAATEVQIAATRVQTAVPETIDTRDADGRDPEVETRNGGTERELLERIAALETYIAGRADHWREMEQQVGAKSTRIAELEAELAQRIGREQQLEERLHLQGGLADALRDKLRRMNRRLEHASASPDPELDSTWELTGAASEVASIVVDAPPATDASESGSAPELVCLSSDLGERYVMNKEAITIGRAADCDIQIAADFVSRQHATIRREDTDMYIEDESSTNGVYVNAERVRRKALVDGDEITIGESRFRFVGSPPAH